MKRIIFTALVFLSMNALAVSLPLTEGLVNSQVAKAFPKTIKKIELSNPQINLLDGKSVLCMDGVPRIMFLEKPFKACASFTPSWNEKEAKLEATNLELIDVSVQDVGSVPLAMRVVLNEVLEAIGPIVLYKSDSWFLKQVSSIRVEKGMLYLKF